MWCIQRWSAPEVGHTQQTNYGMHLQMPQRPILAAAMLLAHPHAATDMLAGWQGSCWRPSMLSS